MAIRMLEESAASLNFGRMYAMLKISKKEMYVLLLSSPSLKISFNFLDEGILNFIKFVAFN